MKFDNITILLGEFGKYQKILYAVVCVPVIFSGMQMLSSVFTLAIPKHRCKIPELDNDTYIIQGIWHQLLLNTSIPMKRKKDGTTGYDSCKVLKTNQYTSYNELHIPTNASKKDCESWVYDKSVFKSTFITKANLICRKELARASANMILMTGVLFGAVAFGVVSDIFGRKTSLMTTIVLHVAGAFGSAFAPNYLGFVILRFITGMASISMFVTAFVLGMELVGPSYRVAAGIIIELFWCLGLYLLCLIAYFVRTWNHLLLGLACPSVILFACFWFVPESPRWLIAKGRFDDVSKIINKCAKISGVTLPEKLIDVDTQENTEQTSVLKMFTEPRLLVRTLIIYLNWIVVSMVYYGLGLNVGNLDGDIYVNFAINSSMEVGAYLLCLFALDRVGRRTLHAGTMILGGAACICTIFTTLYAGPSLIWTTVVLANVGKFGISAAYAIIVVWSAELFPTPVRNSGMGSSSMMATVGSIMCPYIADAGNFVDGNFGKALPLLIFGGLSLAAGFLSLFLPETRGKKLPETITDAKRFGQQILLVH